MRGYGRCERGTVTQVAFGSRTVKLTSAFRGARKFDVPLLLEESKKL